MTSSRRAGGTATVLVLLSGVAIGASGCDTFTGPGSSSSGAGGMVGSSSSDGTTMSSMSSMSSMSTMTTSTMSSMSTMSTTIASSSSGMPDPCDVGDGDAIPEMCGVFVKEGAANGVGTQASPFGSIMAALDVAGPAGKPVYVCQGAFDEAVVIDEGKTILGGVDCTNGWHWVAAPSGAQRTLVAPATGVPLIVASEPTAGIVGRVFGFTFHAAAGAAPGDSSIAAIVQGAPVVFERTRFEAGAGHDGTDGVQNAPAAAVGGPGNYGSGNSLQTSCDPPSSGTYSGGLAKVNPSCTASVGGAGGSGGDGFESAGGSGMNGGPLDPLQAANGKGGRGQFVCGPGIPPAWCAACAPGTDGITGVNGDAGDAGKGLGMFDGMTYVGANGGAGDPGGHGGGGGGGGGARTGNGCSGDSGGSGGAGGCGGASGAGGTYGGSSIGIVVANTANVTFIACSASSVQAGRGGNGAPGLAGAGGGIGGKGGDHVPLGMYGTNACSGGQGGTGGHGGHGGGASGGHSVGLVCSNTTCDQTGLTFDPVMPTFAGVGGIGDGTNDGSPGQAVETLTL